MSSTTSFSVFAAPLFGAFAGALSVGLLAVPASADVIDDPLHGYCAGAGQCIDNGINSPTTINPPSNFGFTVSPGPASGDFRVEVLTPNNEPGPASFAVTGTLTGTATLFSATPWTSGDLASYLGISASPNNPIGAYLPSTQSLDPGATGFFRLSGGSGEHHAAASEQSKPIAAGECQPRSTAGFLHRCLPERGQRGCAELDRHGE